jgi:rare lipoprotein A
LASSQCFLWAEGRGEGHRAGEEASFYDTRFYGKKTASGKKFNQRKRTAAHPTLPLGTKATVTNLENGKAVDVQITDRGPYAKGRDIDLSKKAAEEIGLTKKEGEAPVKIEATVPPEGEPKAAEAPEKAKDTGQQGK